MNNSQKLEDLSTNQFLTFVAGKEEYGVDITKVMEIRGWQETTAMPDSPSYMKGVIDLRGTVVPIFDLRNKFGLGDTEIDSLKVVIVLNFGKKTIGVLVDGVSDILTIENEEIKEAPETNSESQIDQAYINGLISKEDNMIILLNIEKLFDIENF